MMTESFCVLTTRNFSQVYNSAITVCARSNQREKAAALLKEMLARGLSPNVVTFSAAISATCGHDGDWRAAMQILADARGGSSGVGYVEVPVFFMLGVAFGLAVAIMLLLLLQLQLLLLPSSVIISVISCVRFVP